MKFTTLLLLMSLADKYGNLTAGERKYTTKGQQLYAAIDEILSMLENHEKFPDVILPLYRSIIHKATEERDLLIVEALKLCVN